MLAKNFVEVLMSFDFFGLTKHHSETIEDWELTSKPRLDAHLVSLKKISAEVQ